MGYSLAGKGCVDYSLHISDNGGREGSPPWNDKVIGYPPPEEALNPKAYTPYLLCGTDFPIGGGKGGKVSKGDVDKVINDWCGGSGGW